MNSTCLETKLGTNDCMTWRSCLVLEALIIHNIFLYIIRIDTVLSTKSAQLDA